MNIFRKTKIVCTIGPVTESEPLLRDMINIGMNVARLNFSHGTHAEHKVKIDLIKKLRTELNQPIALLLDTKGPEVRTGDFKEPAMLVEGETVRIRHDDILGDEREFSVSYKNLHEDLGIGSRILIDDGLVALSVERIEGQDLICRILNGGVVSSRKSINLPETIIHLPALTAQDEADLAFAVEQDFDFIAASFIRKPSDVMEIKRLLEKLGGGDISVISKIENREGVSNFESILAVSDGIMVARGDLGVEIPAHEVPTIQKHLIKSCYMAGKPCITATQMLDSMIRNPRPTRAEASDVANAILDGTSAIMLSGETAAGKYPLEALKMMDQIASYTEQNTEYWERFDQAKFNMTPTVANAVSHACCMTARDLKAKAVIAVTHAGRTARLLSRFRPGCPIVATTVKEKAYYQLGLSWGVIPFHVDEVKNTDELFELGKATAVESGVVENGDLVVVTGGTPVGMSGTTNTLKVQSIGSVLVKGKAVGRGQISGEVLLVTSETNKDRAFSGNYILVAEKTDRSMIPLMRKAAALVVESPDDKNHAITVGETLDIPVIYAADNATKILKNGAVITIDTTTGIIS